MDLLATITKKWTEKQRKICWAAEEIEGHEAYPKDIAKKLELYKLVAYKLGSVPAIIKKQLSAASYDVYRQAWDGVQSFFAEIEEYSIGDRVLVQKSYISYLNVGQRKMKQNNFREAQPLLEEALKFAKNDVGTEDKQLIYIYLNLAELYSKTYVFEKAEDCFNEALRLLDLFPKSTLHIETLDAQSAFFHLKRDMQNARQAIEEALLVAQDILISTHRMWGILYNNLAVILFETGNYRDAIIYYEKAMSFDSGAIENALRQYYLAWSYEMIGNIDEAKSTASEALEVFESNLPKDHNYIVNARRYLSFINENKKGDPR